MRPVHRSLRALPAILLIAALILAGCAGSSGGGDTPIRSAGVLRVGTEGVYSPFSYHDAATGQLVGYDVDVARAVADEVLSGRGNPDGIHWNFEAHEAVAGLMIKALAEAGVPVLDSRS